MKAPLVKLERNPLGRAGIHLAATGNSRESRVGMEAYIDHANSKSMFKQLLAQKEVIESELHRSLDWQELPDGHACRILQVRPDSPLVDEAPWPVYFAWLRGRDRAHVRRVQATGQGSELNEWPRSSGPGR